MEFINYSNIVCVIGAAGLVCLYFLVKNKKSKENFYLYGMLFLMCFSFGGFATVIGINNNKILDVQNNLTEEIKGILDVEEASIVKYSNSEYKYKIENKIYNIYVNGSVVRELEVDFIEHNGKIIYERK